LRLLSARRGTSASVASSAAASEVDVGDPYADEVEAELAEEFEIGAECRLRSVASFSVGVEGEHVFGFVWRVCVFFGVVVVVVLLKAVSVVGGMGLPGSW